MECLKIKNQSYFNFVCVYKFRSCEKNLKSEKYISNMVICLNYCRPQSDIYKVNLLSVNRLDPMFCIWVTYYETLFVANALFKYMKNIVFLYSLYSICRHTKFFRSSPVQEQQYRNTNKTEYITVGSVLVFNVSCSVKGLIKRCELLEQIESAEKYHRYV